MSHLLFHGVAAVAEAGFLIALARWPGSRTFVWGLTGVAAVGVVATLGFGPFGFGLVRLASWGVFVHAPITLLLAGVVLHSKARKLAVSSALLGLLICIAGFDAFVLEPNWLVVTRVRLQSAKLDRPLRIAVLADIQTDRVGEHERDALALALGESPDLVLFLGDYVQLDDGEARELELRKLNDLLLERDAELSRVPLGVFAVAGNVDRPDWTEAFRGVSAVTTTGTAVMLDTRVRLTGLSLQDSFDSGLRLAASSSFQIVMGHAPDFALGAVEADLLLAGHTHGGQVALPLLGPLVTASEVPRSWASGVTRLPGERTLIVSRGIGMQRGDAPRLRFWCRPEVVIIDVQPDM